MSEDTHNWDPLSVDETAELLSELKVPWCIAGGWAIDLFVGHETRPHDDTDVLIRRDDQLEVQRYLWNWDLHKTQQPGLKPWPMGEFLNRPVDDIWCRRTPESPWSFELMLLDTEADDWVFKRDPSIRGPLHRLIRRTPSGVAYLAPEIQLLYKARPEILHKDQADFDAALPLMTQAACKWLLQCLEKRFTEGHDWADSLRRRLASKAAHTSLERDRAENE